MIKIEKHGYFFCRGRLRTECKCGCVYHTPKKKVKIEEYHSLARYYLKTEHENGDVYFETECPECRHTNKQWLKEMESPKENNDERSNEDPDERTGAAHI
jgi:hypothetical protein